MPTISKAPPTTRATFGFDDVKTQGAGELVVGGTIGMVPTPYVAVIVGKGPKIVNVACAGVTEAIRTRTRINTACAEDFRDKCMP